MNREDSSYSNGAKTNSSVVEPVSHITCLFSTEGTEGAKYKLVLYMLMLQNTAN